MASTTNLLNRALALIGAKRIVSMEGADSTSQLIRDTYEDVRQAMLASHYWPFATFSHQLAQQAAPQDVGPQFSYRKPQANNAHGPLVRSLGVFTDPQLRMPAYNFLDGGQVLYSDDPALWFLGTFDIVDPNQMHPLFREALTFKLASDYALPLSNSRSLMDEYRVIAENALLRARAIADMEGPPTAVPISTWEAARFGGMIEPGVRWADPTAAPSG